MINIEIKYKGKEIAVLKGHLVFYLFLYVAITNRSEWLEIIWSIFNL